MLLSAHYPIPGLVRQLANCWQSDTLFLEHLLYNRCVFVKWCEAFLKQYLLNGDFPIVFGRFARRLRG